MVQWKCVRTHVTNRVWTEGETLNLPEGQVPVAAEHFVRADQYVEGKKLTPEELKNAVTGKLAAGNEQLGMVPDGLPDNVGQVHGAPEGDNLI